MDREALEQAIAALEAQRAVLGDAVVETSLKALRKQLGELDAAGRTEQRKLATVLFIDTVGSTEMTYALDPEDNLAIMGKALRLLSEPIEARGGRIVKTMGDGLMAVFGIPTAHENDPDRAVRAALNMLAVARHYAAELEEQWRITGYQVRLGINTGLIVISGREGSEELSGATINLAARLEQAADPGTILISGSTQQHVGGAFDLQPLEPIMAKGFPEPVPVYRVRAARPYSFRSRRRGVAGIVTKLVGRESELNMLQDAYQKVIEAGEQRVVTIVGEAGIGKSRLLHEFENWLDEQSAAERKLFRGRSQPEKQAMPYAFLRDLFASQFNVQDDDAAGVVRKKIEAGFSEEPRAGERGEILPSDVKTYLEKRAHFIGQLLGYDFRGSNHLASIMDNPQKLRDRALGYLDDYFRDLCASGSAVILLEDLHWVDDSSLDVLSSLSLSMRNQPLLIIGAARPELLERRPDWYEGRAFHRRLDLQPLSEQESRNLVIDVLHEAENVPDALLDLIVSNAEGNPFYVEELIKMLVQQGVVVREERRWRVLTGLLAELNVPPSLSGVLQARLDRLSGEERAVLQQASVIGRVFWDVVVIYLDRRLNARQSDEFIDETLVALQEKEIVFRRELSIFAGADEYFFKHALLREVAYESVLIKARRTYHSLVADWLIERSNERSGEVVGLIAHHLQHAGRLEAALVYLRQAARQAAQRFALAEALRFFDKAVELVESNEQMLGSGELTMLRSERGEVHAQAADFDSATADLRFALQKAQGSNDLVAQRTLLTSLGMVYRRADDYEQALRLLSEAVEVAKASGAQSATADSLYHLGSVYWSRGENKQATPIHQEALDISRALGLHDLVAVQATHGRAEAYVTDGRPDLALPLFEESLQLSRQIGDRSYEAENLQMISTVNRGPEGLANYQIVKKAAEEALEICRAAHLDWHVVAVLDCLSAASRGLGDYQSAFQRSREAAQTAVDIGVPRLLSFVFQQHAMLYLDLGLLEQAEVFLRRALQASEEAGSAFFLPIVQAGLSVAGLRQGDLSVATFLEEVLASALARDQNQQAAGCLEALAELSVIEGENRKVIDYTDQLLYLAERGGMRERAAQAHRWRGLALLDKGEHAAASEELKQAAVLADAIGSPRLLWDVHDALAYYYGDLGDLEMAVHHRGEVKAIVASIATSLEDEDLKAGLPLSS